MIDPKNLPVFPGVSRPSSDFPAVRSELRAWPMYREVDLGSARSLAAGTAEVLPLCGNMIYIDPRANSGYATLHVQDESSIGNTPITALPGQVLKVPFTQIILENDAQPGQVLRIIYGTDLDFDPTNAAGVSVLNAINVNDVISPSCRFINDTRAPGVGFVADVILAPASNVSGVNLRSIFHSIAAGAGGFVTSAIMAAAAAPTSFNSQAAQVILTFKTNAATTAVFDQLNPSNRRIPGGWGLYHVNQVSVAPASCSALLSLEIL